MFSRELPGNNSHDRIPATNSIPVQLKVLRLPYEPALLMINKNSVSQENFDALLGWLAPNREGAGEKYEKIRARLIRFFAGRGCFEAEELADETINRVMLKLPQIIDHYSGEPALYFYGVADKIHLEWLRRRKKIQSLASDVDIPSRDETQPAPGYECLETCLGALPDDQRDLVVAYYQEEKGAKIRLRKGLAERLGIGTNALQIRMHRIRSSLLRCVESCVAKKIS